MPFEVIDILCSFIQFNDTNDAFILSSPDLQTEMRKVRGAKIVLSSAK